MESCNILTVEDELIIAEHLRCVLELLGHRVTGVVDRVSQAFDNQALTVEGEQALVGRAYQAALMGRLNMLASNLIR